MAQRCRSWEASLPPPESRAVAVVVPHAGWTYSGRIAYVGLRELANEAETIVVVGGHLRPGDPVRLAPERAYETPSGQIEADGELADYLERSIHTVPDVTPDNTVEVQLPIVRYLHPNARCLALRAAPDEASAEVGATLAAYARETARRVVVAGSTDLTHYGPAYRFEPMGRGDAAAEWARKQNDAAFIDAVVRLEAGRAARLGVTERAACSAGAAAVAIGFAREHGVKRGELLEYGQSLDVRRDDSFVGYAAIRFSTRGHATSER